MLEIVFISLTLSPQPRGRESPSIFPGVLNSIGTIFEDEVDGRLSYQKSIYFFIHTFTLHLYIHISNTGTRNKCEFDKNLHYKTFYSYDESPD